MDFVGTAGGGGGGSSGLSAENGPILYSEPNRTSAIDDLRSVVIYVFIITIFLGFFLILPGIRNEKFPTFLCITTSLIVTSIILIALFGTTWHVGQVSISAPYKAFSKDRIQGDLSVRIGLRSVNISLRAQKYYEPQPVRSGPVLLLLGPKNQTPKISDNGSTAHLPPVGQNESQPAGSPSSSAAAVSTSSSFNDELLDGPSSPEDGSSSDSELDSDEAFAGSSEEAPDSGPSRLRRASIRSKKPQTPIRTKSEPSNSSTSSASQRVGEPSVERSNVDINYNERFYWIGPEQMRQEHHGALERGLPYPILTVVEYLSQDEAGFSWSRQYRLAGYYAHMLLWLSLCCSILMFFLHCATPKYGIYTMQILGCLMLFTNFTYSALVPTGNQKLVIPFEGESLRLKFGWNYWLVFIGGCLSLSVGSLIVLIDSLFPNYIFTTILDVDFDSHNKYLEGKRQSSGDQYKAGQAFNNQARQHSQPHNLGRSGKASPFDHSTASTIATSQLGADTCSRPGSALEEEREESPGSGATLARSEAVIGAGEGGQMKSSKEQTAGMQLGARQLHLRGSSVAQKRADAPHLSELFTSGPLIRRKSSSRSVAAFSMGNQRQTAPYGESAGAAMGSSSSLAGSSLGANPAKRGGNSSVLLDMADHSGDMFGQLQELKVTGKGGNRQPQVRSAAGLRGQTSKTGNLKSTHQLAGPTGELEPPSSTHIRL